MKSIDDLVREARTIYLMDAGDMGIRASVVLPNGDDDHRYGHGYGETAAEATEAALQAARARIDGEREAA